MTTLYHSVQSFDSLPTTPGIYKITCKPTGMFYIGSTVNLRKRWISHRTGLLRNEHGNPKLQRAWNKYGEDAFVFEVLEFILAPFVLEREQYWLDKLKPFGKKGFNIAHAANSTLGRETSPETRARISAAHQGKKASPETRAKLSAMRKGKPRPDLVGKAQSPEAREKNRLAQLGKKGRSGWHHTPEARAKMSAASTRRGRPAPNRGIKHTPEHREKIRLAVLKRPPRSATTCAKMSVANTLATMNRRKALIVTDPDGRDYTVVGIREFCREHGLDRSSLLRVAKGQAHAHHGWKARFPESPV